MSKKNNDSRPVWSLFVFSAVLFLSSCNDSDSGLQKTTPKGDTMTATIHGRQMIINKISDRSVINSSVKHDTTTTIINGRKVVMIGVAPNKKKKQTTTVNVLNVNGQ